MSKMQRNSSQTGQNKVAYPMRISLASPFTVNLNLLPHFTVACSALP